MVANLLVGRKHWLYKRLIEKRRLSFLAHT